MKFKNYLLRKGTQPNGASMISQASATGRMVVREVNGTIAPYTDAKGEYIKNGYNFNDIVYMVVKAIVDKTCVAPWAAYKIVNEKEYQKALVLRKALDKPGNLDKYKACMTKALEPYETDDKLNKLLKYPNEENSLSKHHALLWTYKLVTGDYFERWDAPSGGPNAGIPDEWEVLPAHFMNILTNKAYPLRVTGYKLLAGINKDFSKEEVLHESYPNLDWSVSGSHFYGLSPVKVLSKRIQRNNESQATGAALQKNGGQHGFTWMKIPGEVLKDDFQGEFTNDQVNDLKAKYDELVRDPGSVGSSAFSGYEVGFTPVGLSPVDLDSVNMETHDFRMACGAYNFPGQILGDPASKTYNNMTEAYKALILNCCLPLLSDREQSLTRQLHRNAKYKSENIIISYDLSQYSELEVNKAEQANYLAASDWLTPNERRVIAGETTIDDPLMDKIYMKQGYVPLDEVGTTEIQPLDENDNLDYGKTT